jgi:serine protease SohB
VAQAPNFHRLLKKAEVDFEEMTAGRHKRSLTLFGENTDDGRAHFREKLEETHRAFKDFVRENRPTLDIEAVGDGDFWYGTDALRLGLVDRIGTSDAYLFAKAKEARVIEIKSPEEKSLLARLREMAGF